MEAQHRQRFEEVYDRYGGVVLAYAARRTTQPQDAADVMAETFAIAWRRIIDVPPGDEARPWLFGVARRVLANHHRSARRRRNLDGRLVAVLSHRGAADPDAAPSEPDIAAALAKLSDDDRELLTLIAWDGLDREAAAAAMGVSTALLRVRLHRARRRFAAHLGTAAPTGRPPRRLLAAPAGVPVAHRPHHAITEEI